MRKLRPIENRSIAEREQLYLAAPATRRRTAATSRSSSMRAMREAASGCWSSTTRRWCAASSRDVLARDPAIEVVGAASDAHVAREKIKKLNPDVLTLDIEMPKMDGLTFLHNLMRLRPMPVVMVSSLTERGADVTLDALAMGAVDFLPKPRIDIAATLQDYGDELIAKIKTAARASVRALDAQRACGLAPANAARARGRRARGAPARCAPTDRIIAIGASTGGTEAIKEVLMRHAAGLPRAC